MKKTLTTASVLCALLLFVGFYLWGPSEVPAGQQPLLTISSANFGEFQKAFDVQADGHRVVLLVSPT